MSFMHQPRTFGRAVYKRQSDDFARQRSRYLDIFSEAELRLSQLYIKLGLKKHDGSFGQKVGELSSLKPSSGLSKTTTLQIRAICADLSRHVKMRNGLVHATMSVGTKSNEDVAFFQKTSDAATNNPVYFVMSFDDFAMAIEALNDLTARLQATVIRPSSPPQPKQGAASGP
jgi:hypothetical protein